MGTMSKHWDDMKELKITKHRENISVTAGTAVCGRLYFLKLAKAVYAIQYVPYNMTLTPLLEFKLFL